MLRTEQKAAGRKHLDVWLTVEKDALQIVVHDYRGEHPVSSYYEYRLWFQCSGIHEIERRKRKKVSKRPPLRQLHIFANAHHG
jgi:aromatic ring-cleaving dioxygenase